MPNAISEIENGIWRGVFYGALNGTIGSSLAPEGRLGLTSYFVIPARLTSPTKSSHRAVVWIGAVSGGTTAESVGALGPGDQSLLTLTLKVSFEQIGQIVYLLRAALVTEFSFEVSGSKGGEVSVIAWSADYAIPRPHTVG